MSSPTKNLENRIRKSLPNDSRSDAPLTPQRRNTVSSGFNPKPKKSLKIAAIAEDETDDTFSVENERKREVKIVKKPSVVSNASKSSFAYENTAYEGNLKRTGSAANSERSTTTSRAPSVQSLEIVREQYCCCSRRTRCEKALLVAVTVLGIAIVVLVIVLAAVVANCGDQNNAVSKVIGF
ncbi:uncharacterized protein LOC132698803 [Cylas formicarius]|uniref:uncharacterized protein LOC132698803 n=1 Tax=Cylas formicarius TaxID=197179 RepID=UPI0029585069|nr:uncharacterized protein LOC132698803 [Cylas formicarius]XP_060521079.1 uncharacterized protein LOC132698803 [Cylas formicarius]XP_060521080.1 uncharacterized protein LOC132698803 [Cylas formicarius]XP_060521081.1 uncharacterized protein LOC132698803 [Cylas formicarius]